MVNLTKETKADKIRQMYTNGFTIKEISIKLVTHYSYVHSVVTKLRNQAKSANKDIAHTHTKAANIRTLHEAGYTTPEIVAQLEVTHSHVSNVLRYTSRKCRKEKEDDK
ncbi:MAG: hypothetical protein DDT19_02539 [Syntrophomonadaceae bacterium]|nr:hypothetical protein [Bacillota bacterium]